MKSFEGKDRQEGIQHTGVPMIRTFVFGLAASVALLGPLSITGKVDAHEYRHEHRHDWAYRVYYRDPCRPAWVLGGTCRCFREAEVLAERFRCRGFAISIR